MKRSVTHGSSRHVILPGDSSTSELSVYFFSPASQLTDKLVRWFLIQRTRPHYSRSHFSNSRARCHPPPSQTTMPPPPLHPPLSLLLHLLRSQAPAPLLRQAPSCYTPLCRPRRYISSNLNLVVVFFGFSFCFFFTSALVGEFAEVVECGSVAASQGWRRRWSSSSHWIFNIFCTCDYICFMWQQGARD